MQIAFKGITGRSVTAMIKNFKNSLWNDEQKQIDEQMNKHWDCSSESEQKLMTKRNYQLTDAKAITSRIVNSIVENRYKYTRQEVDAYLDELQIKIDAIRNNIQIDDEIPEASDILEK